MKSKAYIALVVILSTVVCGWLPYRAVAESTWQNQLLWHDDEAFAFINSGQIGWNSSYAFHLLSVVFGIYGAPPEESRRTMTVFRITSESIEEYRLDGELPFWLIAADGYVSSYNARWINGRFEPYTPRKIPEAFARNPPQTFSDVEGWSKRTFLSSYSKGARPVDFQLRGLPARLVLSGDAGTPALDVERTGVPAKRLMVVNRRPRRVSRNEYHQIFRK